MPPSLSPTSLPPTSLPHRLAAIDISDTPSLHAFEGALEQLQAQGWNIGKGTGSENGNGDTIELLETGESSTSGRGLLLCRSRDDAERHAAIAPEAFAILRALGHGEIETALAASVPDGPVVDKVIVGFNWTMVRAGALCGVARSPGRATEGARTIRPPEGFAGTPLAALAAHLRSADPLSRSIGLAAINAWWNRPGPTDDVQPHIRPGGGLGGITAPGDGVVIIGGFRAAQKRLPEARIIEREPKPGDIPVEEAPAAYAQAKILAITAQTLMNGSLEPILHASRAVPHRMLAGPSCPACPLLFEHGLDEVSGAVIIDPDAAETFITETGTMIMLDHIAQSRYLRRPAQEDRDRDAHQPHANEQTS